MKKAVFITYNQALTERVAFLLDQLQIKGFTQWPLVNGAGTETGEPRMGSHTWPEMNSATITIVEEEMVPLILKYVKALDEVNKENGIRAFVWAGYIAASAIVLIRKLNRVCAKQLHRPYSKILFLNHNRQSA